MRFGLPTCGILAVTLLVAAGSPVAGSMGLPPAVVNPTSNCQVVPPSNEILIVSEAISPVTVAQLFRVQVPVADESVAFNLMFPEVYVPGG